MPIRDHASRRRARRREAGKAARRFGATLGVIALGASVALSAAAAAGHHRQPGALARRLTLGGGDSFVVSGSRVLCLARSTPGGVAPALVCGLRDPHTGGLFRRSRIAVISDTKLAIRPAADETAVAGHEVLFRAPQSTAPAVLPPADSRGRSGRVVLRSGDTAVLGGTHVWCTDRQATLTCTKVWSDLPAVRAGTFAIAISGTSVGVAQAGLDGALVPLVSWPLVGGH
jgi:hypothetical protein